MVGKLKAQNIIAGSAVVIVLLAGCMNVPVPETAQPVESSAVTTPDPQPEVTTTHEIAPAPETEAPAVVIDEPPTTVLDQKWKDSLGYEFRIVIDGSATYTPTTEIANALPGKAEFSFTYTTTGTLYNLTPGRIAPVPATLTVGAAWEDNSEQCELLGAQNSAGNTVIDSWCGRLWEVATDAREIPIGGSTGISVTFGSIFPIAIDEASASTVTETFSKISAWVIASDPDLDLLGGRIPETCFATQDVCR